MACLKDRNFLIRKLHSLSGIIPIGFFLIEHLSVNILALQGPEAYNAVAEGMQSLPFLSVIEFFYIVLPLTFHALYGLWIVYVAQNNVLEYKYYRNWMFYLQRITALITTVFVIYHVYTTRLAKTFFGTEINYDFIHNLLSSPAAQVFYIIGLLAAVFHFTNGLWTFLISWGITVGPKSQRISGCLCSILFIVLSIVGLVGLSALV